MLNFLKYASEQTLDRVYTQDETWIYLENPRKSMWILQSSPIPTISKQKIASKKIMFSIIWPRTGIKSIVMLKQNEKFNKVLGDLKKNYKTQGKILHMDNALPHLVDKILGQLEMRRLVHPPYSLDLALSDFYLFGYLKMALEGCFFKNKMTRILNTIPTSCFKKAYDD